MRMRNSTRSKRSIESRGSRRLACGVRERRWLSFVQSQAAAHRDYGNRNCVLLGSEQQFPGVTVFNYFVIEGGNVFDRCISALP